MPSNRDLKVDHIYSELRKQIIDRSIPPGTKMTEARLSLQWSVSRTPIREVLRRLESEGLVSSTRFKGFVVDKVNFRDIEELYAIKISLEGLAGRLSTRIILEDQQKLKYLERLCREMETLYKKGDIETYVARNTEFHNYICNSCGNKWLVKFMETVESHVQRFIVKSLHIPNRIGKSVQEHWEIYDKLKMGNSKGVERAIGMHFTSSLNYIRNELMGQTQIRGSQLNSEERS